MRYTVKRWWRGEYGFNDEIMAVWHEVEADSSSQALLSVQQKLHAVGVGTEKSRWSVIEGDPFIGVIFEKYTQRFKVIRCDVKRGDGVYKCVDVNDENSHAWSFDANEILDGLIGELL